MQLLGMDNVMDNVKTLETRLGVAKLTDSKHMWLAREEDR